ncbi:MAG: MYXO-CTERM sorting domain-containing protein, partial [Polyangia bacterium]
VRAATYYVAPTGNNSNPGTIDQPFATMARGQQAAAAGDTVYLRGGTYKFVSGTDANAIMLNKSGTSGNPIKYWAYQTEVPVFDFSGMTALARITGIRVTASWVHLKGLEVKLVPQNITTQNESWGIYNDGGDSNVYEMLNLHHNMGPGFFLGSGGHNLILNCDSHHNYDPKSKAGDGENADGFGCHPKAGDVGNVFRGIRAWWNTDDGYDSINAFESCLVENSWAWLNGYLPDKMVEPMRDPSLPPGNGNGFKLGGYGINGTNSPASPPRHTIRFSVAFLNRFAGFFANYHTAGNYYYNNTGFKNVESDFNMLGLNNVNRSVLRNNVAYGPSPTANLTGTDNASNSWNLPVQVTEADFQSISTMGMDGPRQADGSLPVVPFMRLQPDSDLIDKGMNIGFPFSGMAPDLGAYESGNGAGGGGGAGGAGGHVIGGTGGTAGRGPGTAGGAGTASGGTGSGGAATGDGGSAGDGSGGASVGDGTGGGPTASGGASAGGAAVATGGSDVTGGAGGRGTGAQGTGHDGAASDSGGCGCSVGTPSPSTAAVGLAAMILVLASSRRRKGAGPR